MFEDVKDFDDYYCASYSVKQKCYDIDLLCEMLKRNIQQNLDDKDDVDFKIMFIGSYDRCEDFIKKFKRTKEHLNYE